MLQKPRKAGKSIRVGVGGGAYSWGVGGGILSESQVYVESNLFMITHLHLVQEYLSKENLQTLPHPTYCLDIALWDFFLFPKVSQDAGLTPVQGVPLSSVWTNPKECYKLSLAGAATSMIFVRQTRVCRDKTRLLSQQKYACRDKHIVATRFVCRDKNHTFGRSRQ